MQPRWTRTWPFLALLAALAALYGPFVATGGLLAVGDGLGYYFPVRVLAAQALWQGELPFWNPGSFGGVPLHAMLQAGVFFPGNWSFLLLPPVAAMNVAVLGASFVAGASMLLFARACGLGRLAALTAALPFMGAGYLVAHLEWITNVQVVALIPAVLWAIERFRQSLDARWALAASAIYALQLLAGYPQLSLITLALAGLYGLWRGLDLPAGQRMPYVLQLGLAGGLGLVVAGVELLPVIDVIAKSDRLALSYADVVQHSLPPRQLPTLAFPYMFGGAMGELFHVPYWGAGPYYIELTGYVGLAPLLLAPVACLRWRTTPYVRFWAIAALVALVLALGEATPLYRVWAAIPGLRAVRVPGRHLLEVDLALCLLAGFGLQALLDAEPAQRRRWLAFGAAWLGGALGLVVLSLGLGRSLVEGRLQPFMPAWLNLHEALSLAQPAFWVPLALFAALVAALAWLVRRPTPAAGALLLVVMALDLGLFARGQNWHVFGPRPGPLARPAAPPGGAYRSVPLAWGVPSHDFPLLVALHLPLYAAIAGERSAGGYESFVASRYGKLLGGMDNMTVFHAGGPWGPANHALDVLGVRTLYLDANAKAPPLAPPRWRPLDAQPRVKVYENTRALPRAWRVSSAQRLEPAAVDARMMGDAGFEPAATALVEEGPAAPTLAAGPAAVTPRSANRLAVTTNGAGPGLVVVNESYDEGWHAFAGTQELPVRRVDGLVLGVDVPAGPQAFELRYRPPRWGQALGVTLAGIAAWLLWALCAARALRPR